MCLFWELAYKGASQRLVWINSTEKIPLSRGQLKCDGTRAETTFRLSAKRTSPFKSAGASVQSTTGSRVVHSAAVMLDTPCSEVVWRVLATHSIHQFPLHFPPVRHHISTGLYCNDFKLPAFVCGLDCVWNVMAHAQKLDFVFRRNGRVHLNRRWTSVQSTTGSRGVRISGTNAGYTMFRGSVKSTGYPLHSRVSPSLPFPCVTVCHHISTGLYHRQFHPRHSQ